jgi:hypothetical protein
MEESFTNSGMSAMMHVMLAAVVIPKGQWSVFQNFRFKMMGGCDDTAVISIS